MELVIGCPVRNRNWILPKWFEAIENSDLDIDYSFVFVVGEDDRETIDMISGLVGDYYHTVVLVSEPKIGPERVWNRERYEHMSYLRNCLLHSVREIGPKYFLSLDSDIIVQPGQINSLIETLDTGYDAVGGLTWFDPIDKRTTNVAMWKHLGMFDSFKRVQSRGIHPVDIIMGIKLMGPKAYNIDYSPSNLGEDLGWCANAYGKISIGFNGTIPALHVMSPEMIDFYDKRVFDG